MAGKPLNFEVLLTEGAEQYLDTDPRLHRGVRLRCECRPRAGSIDENRGSPSRFPERSSYPKELATLGIREYRQTLFRPYRMIYRVTGRRVVIYLIADGRRDMQSLLARRLLGA
jgi:toxin ParE1/3/4